MSASSPAQLTATEQRTVTPDADPTLNPEPSASIESTRTPRVQLGAVALGFGRQRQRVRDRVGDGLGGNLECAVVALDHVYAVSARDRGHRRHGGTLRIVERPHHRTAAQHRYGERSKQRVAGDVRDQDQLGLELTGGGVEPGVQDPRIGAAGAEREVRLGLEQRDGDPSPRERQRDRAADDAGADHRDLRRRLSEPLTLSARKRIVAPSEGAIFTPLGA